MRAAALPAVLTALCGCWCGSVPQIPNPANPFPDIQRVMVPPVWVESGGPADPVEEAQSLAGELAQFPGFTVTFPRAVAAEAERMEVTPATALEWIPVARALGADSVLACVIHEDHRYAPPRFGITLTLLRCTRPGASAARLWEMSTWGQPVRMQGLRDDDRLVAAFQRMRDGQDRMVQRQFARWASRNRRAPDPGWQHLMHVPEAFHRFGYNAALRDLIRLFESPPAGAR